ncbi:MAG: hypothetical protein ACI9C1_002962 [Candidatus Aldehydirespiratoraceae bacterium]
MAAPTLSSNKVIDLMVALEASVKEAKKAARVRKSAGPASAMAEAERVHVEIDGHRLAVKNLEQVLYSMVGFTKT